MTGHLQNSLSAVILCILVAVNLVLNVSGTPQFLGRRLFQTPLFQSPLFQPRQYSYERQCNLLLDNHRADYKTPEIISRYRLPVENHTVQTEDGFALVLFRIPAEGKPVVFLSHGLGCSSTCFLLNCERRALAIKLADEGFDVWLGNFRGNEYSRKHAFASRDTFLYWNHGIDDLVGKDTPLMIDYVLNTTRQARINWVGHGLGTTYMLGLLADRPEYNDRVNLGFSLGGATGVYTEIKHPVMRQLVFYQRIIFTVGRFLFLGKALPTFVTDYWKRRGQATCSRNNNFNRGLCRVVGNYTDGKDPGQISPEVLPLLSNAYPNEFSMKVLIQWLQWYRDEKMTYFNYGYARNFALYGSPAPPEYSLNKISSSNKISFFWAENDWFTNQKDILAGEKNFPGASIIRVDNKNFNHQDFLFGKDADTLIYNKIIEKLKEGTGMSLTEEKKRPGSDSNQRPATRRG